MNNKAQSEKRIADYFGKREDFDFDVTEWDVSNVTTMKDMFKYGPTVIVTKFPTLHQSRTPSFTEIQKAMRNE